MVMHAFLASTVSERSNPHSGRQDFQGDITIQPLIVRAIDHSHPARTDLLENPVMAENLPYVWGQD